MDIPETFAHDLEIEFQGRLRARFSPKSQAVIIEQRVGKNVLPSLPRKFYDNEKRQALAEGYMPIMTVSLSETMKCPECTYVLKVPNRETAQIVCLSCKLKQRSTKITAGFYPLNSSLLHHLKEIDPLRNMDRNMAMEMVERNERMTEIHQKSLRNDAEDYASDNIERLMGIPSAKYSGMKVMEGTEVKGFS